MNREQLEHIIRASGDIVGVQDVIILGSQSILGQFPDLEQAALEIDKIGLPLQKKHRDILLRSNEADIMIPEHEETADRIDGVLGELSSFHHTYGYYAQGVDSTTAVLPEGWRERLIVVCNENTNNVRGHCLEVHDLIIAKLYAGRQKDIDFFEAAIYLQLIAKDILLERLDCSPMRNERKEIIRGYIERGFPDE